MTSERSIARHMIRISAVIALACAAIGCASVDFDYPREESFVIDKTGDTSLAESVARLARNQPRALAGFHPMGDGIDALAARLLLAGRAERSIDVQYYLIKNDLVGRVFMLALLDAADRGVRIRLLIDDVFTAGYDAGLGALDSHPNFEVRIFNPFNRGAAGRTLGAVSGFTRVNRRMHNKSFTIDNQITIIGGRNIADEYFGARKDSSFSDLDVIGIGPVVNEVSTMFDTYWNHETALPLGAFSRQLDNDEARLDTLRESLTASREDAQTSRYAEAVTERVIRQLDMDSNAFTWATYTLVYDSPDKGVRARSKQAGSILTPLQAALTEAEDEILIVSPYFVPTKSGIATLSEIRARGVGVTVITNSLAANNQFTVHSGYAPSRKPLLKQGVKIYEVRPDIAVQGTEFIDADNPRATLHTKAFIVDQQRAFIGSFNFDPRSANINTEMGVIIDDAELARYFAGRVQSALKEKTYTVFLDENDKLRWRGFDRGEEVVLKKEPQTSWWQRFKVSFVGLFPVEGQL